MKKMQTWLWLSVLAVGLLSAAPVFAELDEASTPPPEIESLLAEPEASAGAKPNVYPEDSSVNYSEEFGFESQQNIDHLLGDMENPLAPMPADSTYNGSRSPEREKRDEAQWWR